MPVGSKRPSGSCPPEKLSADHAPGLATYDPAGRRRGPPGSIPKSRILIAGIPCHGIYVTTPERITELMGAWKEIGVTSFIIEVAAPFDDETIERFAPKIRPQVDAA